MARRVLPAIDLSGQPTSLQQNVQAITNILQTMGQAEKLRREGQMLDKVARAVGTLKEGSTIAEAIANITSATQQQPQFGTGLQGILQKIGGGFQPPGGGVKQNILQAIIGQKLKQALAPPAQEKPFTLAPGQERFTGAGERVAGVPKTAAKRTRATVLLNQIDKKIASGALKEGSAEHLRLLGASADKIKTPEDKLKYWQTVLQKTKDAIGTTFEGQESTAELAAAKIEEAKNQIRGKLSSADTAIADPLGIR